MPLPEKSTAAPSDALLSVRELSVFLPFDGFVPGGGQRAGAPEVAVVRQVGFELRRGEIFGLVGESGCGKSLTALALAGLLPPGGRAAGGIDLAGSGDLLELPPKALRRVRGRRLAMVFQEPASALNPILSIGFQIVESLRLHRRLGRREARREATRLLERVAMPEPERRLDSFPHQLSGGQQQRAMLAIALASEPDILLADEPTTALDVTVQAQVLDLLQDLRRELGLTVLLITHDLGVVAQTCDRVAVMYAGEIVEQAPVTDLFAAPSHPYTRALLRAVPRLGSQRLGEGIAGRVPEPGALPRGCAFAPRCADAVDACVESRPELYDVGPERHSRCFLTVEGID